MAPNVDPDAATDRTSPFGRSPGHAADLARRCPMLSRPTTGLAPARANRFGSLLLPGIDFVTFFVCFSVGGLINLSYSNLNEQRGIILLILTAGCIVFFQQIGHYSRRRQFWQETGDVAAAAAIALVIDAALLY
ncbi:MAG: hypothetical protein AAGL66_14485, partial [Pseudomonadota bacterium]